MRSIQVWGRGPWRNLGKIAGLMEKSMNAWEDDDMETFIEDLGDNTMEIAGAAQVPVWTMIGGLSGTIGRR